MSASLPVAVAFAAESARVMAAVNSPAPRTARDIAVIVSFVFMVVFSRHESGGGVPALQVGYKISRMRRKTTCPSDFRGLRGLARWPAHVSDRDLRTPRGRRGARTGAGREPGSGAAADR